ncbi:MULTISPECIES: DNA mismatch repair endonuclease MutL [unclassified Planococcus (in: firmicutes)]|uniref:DNA mismatch repair endonuclease MutL n=1 Tax=unclassified Planococcus (in: firmicutes) TaxID=2662419 RepID=UPI000C7E3EC1|nr:MULTISPECIES: DNA mismatch repair endonuclease MutL [unclassified Planococcus (in: firmicutes)]PKG48072.1 DNA mismatch repair endonuclease MutL [Planococcus sp. Urea-trap-24]PKG91920.1 DNA mismatch repair endonuclease MutL [Planococcus sp. Urea-3u-39]PKH43176.1 DNA mismatch repair endonuclease MutL [Planococcus sp. MB-3u-09]
MGKIRLMDEPLSNKIAAGEVVERPTSVVKELVENAIDAGSTAIEVLLQEAGLTSIQIIDNGAGMDEEDALLSFSRHATSKIENEHDLFRIRTLGFRGEALASIASVSKVVLHTSDGATGTHLEIEGGRLIEQRAGALRQGTDIRIGQLFFNTPARLKYMKTLQTELGHTIDLMNRFALSYPGISFRLVHDGKQLLQTAGSGEIRRVLADIYGVAIAKKMVAFEGESPDYQIEGFASLPEITRANKNYISLFVNGRWVKHYAIANTVHKAYHTFLPLERQPIVVLNIKGDPYLTDVNVHPSKQQIRLSKEKELLELVHDTIRRAIQTAVRAPVIEKPKPAKQAPSRQLDLWKRPVEETVRHQPEPLSSMDWKQDKLQERVEEFHLEPRLEPVNEQAQEPVEDVQGPFDEPESRQALDDSPQFPELEVVGQIHGTYIVAQSSDGFYLVDQHAAQERIKYEFFREKVGDIDSNERQSLLLPLTFHYSRDEALHLKEQLNALEESGVFLEEFGDTTFIVREYPTWFPKGFEQEVIEDLIEQVLAERRIDIKKLREDAAIMMSCKRSIKANHFLQKHDMERLLADLKNAEQPFTCPHGRPVIIHFKTYDIEKMFKRVMN